MKAKRSLIVAANCLIGTSFASVNGAAQKVEPTFVSARKEASLVLLVTPSSTVDTHQQSQVEVQRFWSRRPSGFKFTPIPKPTFLDDFGGTHRKGPNKSPEPTPTAVTPRANEPKAK